MYVTNLSYLRRGVVEKVRWLRELRRKKEKKILKKKSAMHLRYRRVTLRGCDQFSKASSLQNGVYKITIELTFENFANSSHPPHAVSYEVATISRLLKITVLFCKRALQKRLYAATETCDLKEPAKRSHPICTYCIVVLFRQKRYVLFRQKS